MTSIQHTAPTSTPRRDTIFGLYAPPANHWVRMIYAAILKLRCLLTCTDGVETVAGAELDNVPVALLAASPRSKKVVVVNGTDAAAEIYEGGALVAIVAPGEARELPMAGLLEITGASVSDVTTATVWVTRYLRCACGDDDEPEYSTDPVGSFLL